MPRCRGHPLPLLAWLAVCVAGPAGATAPDGPAQVTPPEHGGPVGPDQVVSWTADSKLEATPPPTWRRIAGPVGTVCVAGDDRVGKSTLLSEWVRSLTNVSSGSMFAAGHTRESHTRGLWSAVVPAWATGLDYHLNLCDSQGLKQVSEREQWRLFSANVFVPSVLVYMLINVVQNDQIRDLAQMAHQFQQLSSAEFERFGQLLSPHLVVVLREESDFGASSSNATEHLEKALESPGFAEDKDLIRRVFRTREAWSLEELPLEARRELRSDLPISQSGAGDAYRNSSGMVLERVLAALNDRRGGFHQGGLELSEWYKSVVATVNSRDDGSLVRLVSHAERIAGGQLRRRLLAAWRTPLLAGLLAAFAVSVLSGWLGRWLDFLAWCAWLVACVCYIGTSPLITAPLGGFLGEQFCEHLVAAGGEGAGGGSGSSWLAPGAVTRALCREASPYTAAFLTSLLLGAVTYPLIVRLLRKALRPLPLPRRLGAACIGAIAACGCLQIPAAGALGAPAGADGRLAEALLALCAAAAAVELVGVVRHRHSCRAVGAAGLDIHALVRVRCEEVRSLEGNKQWANHYTRFSRLQAGWRCRHPPVWLPAAMLAQVSALMLWALLIYPSRDLLVVGGVVANCSFLAWKAVVAAVLFVGCGRAARLDQVQKWLEGLPDHAGPPEIVEGGWDPAECAKSSHAELEEDPADASRRGEIEEMRRAQERAMARPQWVSRWD